MGKHSGFSLPGFTRLAPSVYVQDARLSGGSHDPSFLSTSTLCLPPGPAAKLSSRSRETAPPDLIIITSWTGACSKHVAKYTEAYSTLYPGVPILVITTVLSDLTLHSTKHKLKALAPAVAYLLSQEEEPTSTAFSSTSTFPQPYPDHQFTSTAAFFPEPYQDHPHCQPYHNQNHPHSQPYHHHQPSLAASGWSSSNPRFPSILLHAFSEGGAHKATLLARAYLSATTSTATSPQYHHHPHNFTPPSHDRRLPVRALILDSTPGRASFSRATTAFTRSLPGGMQSNALVSKVVGPVVAAGVVGVFWTGMRLRGLGGSRDGDGGSEQVGDSRNEKRGKDNWGRGGDTRSKMEGGEGKRKGGDKGGSFIEETRRALNDDGLWDVRRMARAYLYGEGDEVVGWEDVHDHGVESATAGGGEKGGVGSLMVRFKRTEHCAHARGVINGAVYWAAVRRTWEMREDGGMGLRLGLGRRLSLDSLCWDGDEESW